MGGVVRGAWVRGAAAESGWPEAAKLQAAAPLISRPHVLYIMYIILTTGPFFSAKKRRILIRGRWTVFRTRSDRVSREFPFEIANYNSRQMETFAKQVFSTLIPELKKALCNDP